VKAILIFYDSNSEILHGVVESNNIGKKEERAMFLSDLVSRNSNEKGENGFEYSMEEDKDCKEENVISNLGKSKIIVSLHEVCQL